MPLLTLSGTRRRHLLCSPLHLQSLIARLLLISDSQLPFVHSSTFFSVSKQSRLSSRSLSALRNRLLLILLCTTVRGLFFFLSTNYINEKEGYNNTRIVIHSNNCSLLSIVIQLFPSLPRRCGLFLIFNCDNLSCFIPYL